MKRLIRRFVDAALEARGLSLVRAQANDGAYWDRYVKKWNPADGPFVGSEWKNEEIFLSLLRKHSGGTALEIGCGGGRITSPASAWFNHVCACDVSKEMLRSNAERVMARNVSHHLLDGFTLGGFEDASMSCVFSHDVFVHFSSLQVYPYLAEIKRVLKPGGIGVISFYNFDRHFDLFKAMSLEFYRAKVYPPHMRVHFVTHEMVEKMLSDLGLSLIETDASNFLIAVFSK